MSKYVTDSDREDSDEEITNEKNIFWWRKLSCSVVHIKLICSVFVFEEFRIILGYSKNTNISYIIYITHIVKVIFKAYKKTIKIVFKIFFSVHENANRILSEKQRKAFKKNIII